MRIINPDQFARLVTSVRRLVGLVVLLAFFALSSAGVIHARTDKVAQLGIGWFLSDHSSNTTTQSTSQTLSTSDAVGFENQLFAAINNARVTQGLAPLKVQDKLKKSARDYAKTMSKSGRFNTIDVNGKSPLDRALDAGYSSAQLVVEDIVAGYQQPTLVLSALLGNSNTAANLYNTNVTEIGIGYWISRNDDLYHHYWVIDFGQRSGLNFNLIINNDAESAKSPNVTLSIGGKGWAQQMLVSNSAKFEGAVWEPYAQTKAWTLSNSYGRKKVYVRLLGGNNQLVELVDGIAWDAPKKGETPGILDDDGLFLYAPAPAPKYPSGPTPTSTPTTIFVPNPTRTPAPAPVYPSPEPGFYQTSGFMAGKVAVGVVFPQCNGVVDTCTEMWNTAAMDQVYSQIQSAMNWWTARAISSVSFVYEQRRGVLVSYEPIRRPQSDEGLWITEAMTNLGFNGAAYSDQVFAYNNYLRQTYAADWGMTIFVANSINSTTGTFSDGYFAYSYVQGPFTVLTYDNDGYGISNLAAVMAHEMGHLFGALDEYPGANVPCSQASGYLVVQNQNSQLSGCASNVDSIMRGGVFPYLNSQVDSYAQAQVGVRVSNAEGLLDPIDTTPAVGINPLQSPSSNPNQTITGIAQDQPYTPPGGDPISINYITKVEYRIDGGNWQDAAPSDGSAAFNKVTQGFTFTTSLTLGTHLIEVRATNRVNHISPISSVSLTIANPTTTPTATATRTATAMPSATATRTATATATAVPPTATRTNTPLPTNTSAATATPLSATSTSTRTATVMPSPTATLSATTVNSPTGLSARVSTGYITLSWKASSTSGVTYSVYRGTASNSLSLFKSGLTTLTYKDTAVVKGTTFYYYVKAVKNGVESAPTSIVGVSAR